MYATSTSIRTTHWFRSSRGCIGLVTHEANIQREHRTSRSSMQQQATEQPPTQVQQPQAVFMRVARDGTSTSPYNHKAGNFSPMTTRAGRVDYNKSTPVAKPTANSKIPLGNNPDAHNRMGQGNAGFNPPYRMVGCPPTGPQSPYRAGLHGRANSGPPLAGVKRNHYGQPVT